MTMRHRVFATLLRYGQNLVGVLSFFFFLFVVFFLSVVVVAENVKTLLAQGFRWGAFLRLAYGAPILVFTSLLIIAPFAGLFVGLVRKMSAKKSPAESSSGESDSSEG